jgi:3-hydroxyacyl-[acyl-carrier-protein] dehydratase
MLKDDLYTIDEALDREGVVTFQIRFAAAHTLYEGHFPGQPVTPGVVLAEIVRELFESVQNTPLRMVTMRQCKFLAAHDPVSDPFMTIEIKWSVDQGYLVQAAGSSPAGVYFKLSACYQASHLSSQIEHV